VDDSGPPLVGDGIPAASRDAWYASWNLGASLGAFCAGCRADMSQGLRELASRYPSDRLALVSHLQDLTIRNFFSDPKTFAPMDAATFEADLRTLGASVMDPIGARWFYTNAPSPTAHPSLEDPTQVTSPGAGLAHWIELMLSDDPTWASLSDP
jgi:hypothetical protein